MDSLVTGSTGDQGFPLAGYPHLYPEGSFGLPFTAEVLQGSKVMDFDGFLCTAEFTRLRQQPRFECTSGPPNP